MNSSISDRYAKAGAGNTTDLLCKTGLLLALSLSFTSLFGQIWYTDGDSDGFGEKGSGHTVYVNGDVLNDLDCNDALLNNSVWGNVGPGDISSPATTVITKISIAPDGTPVALYRTSALNVVVKRFNSTTSAWETLGGDPITTTIGGTVTIDYPDLAIDSHGVPYISFLDDADPSDGINDRRVTVIKYDAALSTWVPVGPRRFSGVLRDGAAASITMDGDVPYVITTLAAGSSVIVMTFDGTNWVTVGSPLLAISADAAESALSVDGNGNLYAAVVNASNQTVVLTCDPSATTPSWTQVGGTTFPFFTLTQNEVPQLALNSANEPYVAYYNVASDAVVVQKYAGGVWSSVGSSAVQTGFGGAASADPQVALVVDNRDVPLVAFVNGTPRRIALMKLDAANAWASAANPSMEGLSLSLAVSPFNNAPYLSFVDLSSGDFATVRSVMPEIRLPSITEVITSINGVTPSPPFLCSGEDVTLSVAPGSDLGHAAQWQWYSGSCGGMPLGAGNSIIITSLTATTTYYVRGEGACINPVVSCTAMAVGVSPTPTWYRDSDGDGFGITSTAQVSCSPPTGYVINNADCNDNSLNSAADWITPGNTGFLSTGAAVNISMAFNGNTPFVAFRDPGVSGGKAVVMRYNGTGWEAVGTPGSISAGAVTYTNIAFHGGVPFVAYRDAANSTKATVMKFDGTNWVSVGGAGFTSGTADNVSMAIDRNNGTIYVLFSDGNITNRPSVMKYDGTGWINVGIPGLSATSGTATFNSITVDSRGTPYVSYEDGSNVKLTVKKFDGTNWVPVGPSAGFSTGAAMYTCIRVDNRGTPYVAYRDNGLSNKAMVMKYNGSAWLPVGSATGISGGTATYTTLALDKSNTPYVAYSDGSAGSRVTVMKFNGTAWAAVGVAGNVSITASQHTYLALDGNNVPYVAYGDGSSTAPVFKCSVRKMIPAANAPAVTGISPSAAFLCPGTITSSTLTLTGSLNDATEWKWYKGGCGAGAALTPSSATSVTVTAESTPGTDVVYYVRGEGACVSTVTCASNLSIRTKVNPSISVSMGADKIVCEDDTGVPAFGITAIGDGLSYQWEKNGTVMGAFMGNSYSLPSPITTGDDGIYKVTVTGDCATPAPVTDEADLEVREKPEITGIPASPGTLLQDRIACEDDTGVPAFEVTATGYDLHYQWEKNGTVMGAFTGNRYSFPGAVATGDAGTYKVTVTGACATPAPVTDEAVLTIQAKLAVTGTPSDIVQCAGTNATFSSGATGTGVTYEWQKDGVTVSAPSPTGNNYSLSSIASSDEGIYTVVMRSTCDITGSIHAARLTVNAGTVIAAQPNDQAACDGADAVTFSVSATGTGLNYQWRTNNGASGTWRDITGENNPDLILRNVGRALNNRSYHVVVSGTCGPPATSDNARLEISTLAGVTLRQDEPFIASDPLTTTVCVGSAATFTGIVNGTGSNYIYQWQQNDGSGWTSMAGETEATLELTGITVALNNISYRVVAGNAGCAPAVSAATTITVNALSGITANPYNIVSCEGGSARFIVQATGDNLGYQWQSATANGWENIPGAIMDELTLLHIGTLMNGYRYRVVVDAEGCAPLISTPADLAVNRLPQLTLAPANAVACMDQEVSFMAAAEGTNMSYHWEENKGGEWTEIPEETSASLVLRRVSPGMNGYIYRVSVSSPGCAPVTSEGAALTVNSQPGQEGCSQSLLVSEGVSPNGDDQLDQWIIQGIELYPNNNVKLYNVWGDLIFERRGYDNEQQAWRGETNSGLKIGQEAPDGTYYYFIDLGNDNNPVLRGFVVLKR